MRFQRTFAVETRHQYQGATSHQREIQAHRQTVDVIERKEAQHHIRICDGAKFVRGERLKDVGDQVEMRQHDAFGQTRGPTGEGKCGQRFAGIVRRFRHAYAEVGLEERIPRFRAARPWIADGVNVPQRGKPREIHAGKQCAVANESDRVRRLQLIADLALAIGRVHGCRDGPGQGRSVVGDAELPAVRQVNADHLSRANSGRYQTARSAFHQFTVCRIGDAPRGRAGGVHDGDLRRMLAAGIENDVVDELALGIVVEPGTKTLRVAVPYGVRKSVTNIRLRPERVTADSVCYSVRRRSAAPVEEPMRGLKGKRVVITGGASGIGAATAARFLEEGSVVAVLDRDPAACEKIRAQQPGIAGTFLADVADHGQVQRAFADIVRDLGGLDVVINNAGISIRHKFLDITPDEWNRVLAVNLTGVFHVAQTAARYMMEHDGGVILNTASTNGIVGYPYYADYNASKAGVIELTRSMALELAPKVRVNAVAPGYVLTPMQRAEYSDEMLEAVNQKIPLRRHAQPEEVAALFAFLASDGCSLPERTGVCDRRRRDRGRPGKPITVTGSA